MNWVKENWFKVWLLVVIFVGLLGVGGFYFASESNKQESIERLQRAELEFKKEQADLEAQRLDEEERQTEAKTLQDKLSEEWVNDCIADAYTEMQTLQANYLWLAKTECAKEPSYCSDAMSSFKENEKTALQKYEKEWVPQCKAGSRVFIDYELME